MPLKLKVKHFVNTTLSCVGLACIALMGLQSACSTDGRTPVDIGNREGILHLGNGAELADLDPHTTTGIPENNVQIALFEGLVAKDPKTLEIMPAVAERWEVSKDQLTYRFYIREQARWSNGDDLTAQDFVWSYQRALSPALANQYAYQLFVIKNAKAFNHGDIEDFSEVAVKALDTKILEIVLENPTPYFLSLLDHHSTFPVHTASIKKFGDLDERATRWTRPGNLVGNGPFTLHEWKINRILKVKKNPLYWDHENVQLNEIHYHPIQNVVTEERMFRAGQLHKTNSLMPNKIDSYRDAKRSELKIHPYYGSYYYVFNTGKPPLDSVKVRLALSFAVDREAIVQKVMRGGELPAYALTPASDTGYTPPKLHIFDPAKAKKLLADAGYPEGKGFPEIELLYNTQEQHKRVAVAIQQMWKKHLNINVAIYNQDWKVYLSSMKEGDFQIARRGWIGDYFDPNTFLDMFVSGSGHNQAQWANDDYDRLISKAGKTADRSQRMAMFYEAETLLMNEAPILPIYIYTSKYLLADSVENWPSNIMDYVSYKQVRLSDAE